MRTGSSAAPAIGRCRDVRDRPLQQRGVDVDPGQRLRDVDLDAAAMVGQARERLRHDLVQADGRSHEPERAGLDPAHVQQVATSVLSRSDSSSIVARNSVDLLGVPRTSCWRRLLTAALIEASGVRRSWETAARIAVRSSLTSASSAASRRLALQARGRGPRRRAAPRTPPGPAVRRPAGAARGSRATHPRRGRCVSVPSSGVGRRTGSPAAPRRSTPRRRSARSTRHGVQTERGTEVLDQAGQRVVLGDEPAGETGERLGLRPTPLRLGAQTRGAVHQDAHHRRDDDEDDDRDRFRARRSSTCGSAA